MGSLYDGEWLGKTLQTESLQQVEGREITCGAENIELSLHIAGGDVEGYVVEDDSFRFESEVNSDGGFFQKIPIDRYACTLDTCEQTEPTEFLTFDVQLDARDGSGNGVFSFVKNDSQTAGCTTEMVFRRI
ncbi:hypothetical protein AB833_14415 [Chromatiales bacterium (ex Bugula neritina AB1)]|nr:hypothetical protein AB833_14415 [Chromatiales bacterium (ex Bugula neritina AB1)]